MEEVDIMSMSVEEIDAYVETVRKQLQDYIDKTPYETGGAIRYTPIITECIEDGDLYFNIYVPFYPNNMTQTYSALDWIQNFKKVFGFDALRFDRNEAILTYGIHYCTPS